MRTKERKETAEKTQELKILPRHDEKKKSRKKGGLDLLGGPKGKKGGKGKSTGHIQALRWKGKMHSNSVQGKGKVH